MNDSVPSSLRIYCSCVEEGIFPWIHRNMRTPFWRFYACLSEGGEIETDKKTMPLRTDRFYLIPCYRTFSTRAVKPFDQFYIHFKLDEYLPTPGKIVELEADDETFALIRRFISVRFTKNAEPLRRLLALAVLSRAILRLPEKFLLAPKRIDPRLSVLCRWIEAHLAEKIDNDRFARHLKMSRNGFIRFFKREIGESPKAYLQRKRIERACEYLHDPNRTIDEIAEETGFCDRYHFSKVFSRILALPPAKFRRFSVGGGGQYFG